MKQIDFELLKERRERALKVRTATGRGVEIGLWREVLVDGRRYPVLECFPVGTGTDEAGDKLSYLISGQKKKKQIPLDFRSE